MILIAGYPYVRENYFATLRRYPKKDALIFLLPKAWKVKGGKVIYRPPADNNVFTARAFFHHSHYLIIGGLLKGWMPGFLTFVIANKKRKNIKAVLTTTEPILLTTLYQAVISRLFGIRHYLFSWENIDYRRKFSGFNLFLKETILKLNLALSEGVICGNQKAVDIFRRYTSKPTPKIPLAGVDTDFFKPEKKEKTFRGRDLNGKTVFLFVGALDERKGVDILIEAFSRLAGEPINLFLIIAGTGEERYQRKITELIRKFNLDGKIMVIDWVSHDKLRILFAISDIFVYPSRSTGGWEEQFGYSMAEAAVAGLPVISTRSGSIEEVVLDGETGLLVESGNAGALRDAMIKLAGDGDLRKKLGLAGRKFITENYSQTAVAGKLYDFFAAAGLK